MSSDVKVAIVTGAARGLGRAMAVGLREAGLAVVAVCRPRPARPGESAGPGGGGYLRVEADVTSEADCERVVESALDRFGGVDVLVNNAALAHDAFPRMHDTDFTEVDPSLWRATFDVNVTGAYLMARAVAPRLVASGSGRIVNISTSMSSMLAPGVLPYGPSKAALEAMTVGWSAHLAGSGVTVNELLPGGPCGPHTPEKHWWPPGAASWPAEIMLPPLRWLVSDASAGVTGRRFIARLWDADLADAEAAAAAGFPAGWALGPHDAGARPPA